MTEKSERGVVNEVLDMPLLPVIDQLKFYLKAGLPYRALRAWIRSLSQDEQAEVNSYFVGILRAYISGQIDLYSVGQAMAGGIFAGIQDKEGEQ